MPDSLATAEEYDIIEHEEASLSPEIVSKIRVWLQPTDYLAVTGEFRRHLQNQAPGTGLWIRETDEYRRWHDCPNHGSLWIKGVPGAGKSVVAASLIQHLKTTEDTPVLFFFFRNIVASNFSPRSLIQDWLAQLLPFSSKLQYALQSRFETQLDEVSDSDLVDLFMDGLSCVPRVYCVADALDEMTAENRPFLDRLNQLGSYRPGSVKLLMTSRPKQFLQSTLRDSSIVHVSLQKQLVDRDVVNYLEHRFDEAVKSSIQHQTKETFVRVVAEKSGGLFLYAKLAMDQIQSSLQSPDPVDVHELTAALPQGLEQTYTDMLYKLRKANSISVELQVIILEAVTHASRPLRLNELASLTQCILSDATTIGSFKELVPLSCGPLIEILEDETMQVIHHSFTEYLRGDTRETPPVASDMDFPLLRTPQAHKHMALRCLRYLRSGSLLRPEEVELNDAPDTSIASYAPQHEVDVDDEMESQEIEILEKQDSFKYQDARLRHPFLAYAVRNWDYHASHYDFDDEEFHAAILEFLQPKRLDFQRWLSLQWGPSPNSKNDGPRLPSGLHLAAFSGLSHLARKLIDSGMSVSIIDSQERTPLHWAAKQGHSSLVDLLIRSGAKPNPEDARGLKPIHLAALYNHAAVMTLLLKAGVPPGTVKTRENHTRRLLGGESSTVGECAILYVSRRGHTESALAMAPFCDVESLERLLCECCKKGRGETVLGILQNSDVSPDAEYKGASALFLACVSGDKTCVKALIERGADVNRESTWRPRKWHMGGVAYMPPTSSPLHRLIDTWESSNDASCKEIFRLLVRAGVNLQARNGKGIDALLLGARKGQFEPLEALLESGADVKARDDKGKCPLLCLLHVDYNRRRMLDLRTLKLLLRFGCDPNSRDLSGETALHHALTLHSQENEEVIEETIRILLNHGAYPDTDDALFSKAISAGPRITKILLDLYGDTAQRDKCWFSLCNVHQPKRVPQFLDLFLANGFDIERTDLHGRTLYLKSLTRRELRQELRRRGAKCDVVDASGNDAFHILASGGFDSRSLMQAHIDDGMDPTRSNGNGDTLLHHIARWYRGDRADADLVQFVIDIGVPVNAANKLGMTALHVFEEVEGLNDRKKSPEVHFIHALGKNFNLNVKDEQGFIALHLASMKYDTEVATLMSAGASTTIRTPQGENVLHLACRARKPNILGYLLQVTGSSLVNEIDLDGRSPLHVASCSGELESVAFLLRHGADVNLRDKMGRSALHSCATTPLEEHLWTTRNSENSWLRSSHKADRRRPGQSTLTNFHQPWHYSKYGERKFQQTRQGSGTGSIASLLIKHGSSPDLRDKYEHTALDLAIEHSCIALLIVLTEDTTLSTKAVGALDDDHAHDANAKIEAQVMLMRPTSSLAQVAKDSAPYKEIAEHPDRYIDILLPEDIANIATSALEHEGSSANPKLYKLLGELIEHRLIHVLKLVPALVNRFTFDQARKLEFMNTKDSRGYREFDTFEPPLHLACQTSKPNMEMLKLFVEDFNVDVNDQSLHFERYSGSNDPRSGGTALHVLASANHWWQTEALRYLASQGANIDATDDDGNTALHVAAEPFKVESNVISSQQPERIFWRETATKVLLGVGADPNILNSSQLSPLHKAAAAPDAMRLLLRHGADTQVGEIRPLFMAIHNQNVQALEVLLDLGADVNSIDVAKKLRLNYKLDDMDLKRYAALYAALGPDFSKPPERSAPLLRLLVERGADMYVALNEETTLLHLIFGHAELPILRILLQEPHWKRLELDRRDQKNQTILMAVCTSGVDLIYSGHRQLTSKAQSPNLRLLDLGADPTLTNNKGMTALHHLLDNPDISGGEDEEEVIHQFINHPKVNPILHIKDRAGYSPLHYALRVLRPAVCQLLLSKSANLLEADPQGQTVLHHVARECLSQYREPRRSTLRNDLPPDYFSQCEALWTRYLSQGGSINVRDNAGNTALHVYVSAEDSQLCVKNFRTLFPSSSDVDVHAVNEDGEGILHVIARRERSYYVEHEKALFEFFMGLGLDPLKEDGKGRSALDIASACERSEILEIMGRGKAV